MDWKRIGRTICALLVVCCLVVNMLPIRAEAVVAETVAVTGAGVMATLFAMSMGVVFVDLTAQLINGMGNSMTRYLYQWGTSAEKLDEVESYLTLLPSKFGGSDGDGSGDDDSGDDDGGDNGASSGSWTIPAAILGGLVGWASSLITEEEFIEVENLENPVPEGYAYYNGVLIAKVPTISDYLYSHIAFNTTNQQYYVTLSTVPLFRRISTSVEYSSGLGQDGFYYTYKVDPGSSSWSRVSNGSLSNNTFCRGTLIWSNFDLYDEVGNLVMLGSVPLDYETVTVKPNTYIGDIPQQVQDGTFDEEQYELPYINYQQIFQGQTDTVAALNNVATQLQNQTMTYEQYMEQIRTEVNTGTDTEVITGTLGQIQASTFWDKLAEIIRAPFEWLGNMLLEGIQAIFVPSEDFLTEKVEALRTDFAFADSIMDTFELFGGSFLTFETSPPVIYIDLGAASGSYYFGGEVPFVDLRWYAAYKPTVDILLSAFLWLVFLWRTGIHLPNIISGVGGVVPGYIVPSSEEKGLVVQRWDR